MTRRFFSQGHLIDSGILTRILNTITEEGVDYRINEFTIGKTHQEYSNLDIEISAETPERIEELTKRLVQIGCYETAAPEAVLKTAPADTCAPEDFYSTTNHRTEIFCDGKWQPVADQRMDALIVVTAEGAACRKLRDVKKGDRIVCGADSVRVFPPFRDRERDLFGFMSNDVSSERSVEVAVTSIAEELVRLKREGGKVVVVAGPVVVHTGGAKGLAALVREGYIHGLLAGNAIAVHDLESVFFGTSLGIDAATGRPTPEGHRNHMRAINRINHFGSIRNAVEAGALTRGLMYEVIRKGIPYCLAGSIRDDGPLPETVTDMIEAQDRYAEIIRDAKMVIMLSSMLHSIGTGNMLPSWVKTVCVDINPAVVTKLSDRGSSQAVGIVSDVGLFVRSLAQRLAPGS